MNIRKLVPDEYPFALKLAWEVFQQFEAPYYSKEGVEEFRSFIEQNIKASSMIFYGAYNDNELVGMLAMRDSFHISLFFVKADYQSKGVGRLLFDSLINDCSEKLLTVNSSPYAVSIYAHLGFMPISQEKVTNGIRYTPMILLETDRLRLRRYTVDDFGAVHDIFADSETMKYYPHPFSDEEIYGWIRKNITRYEDDGFGLWLVMLKDTGEVIGDCGITMQDIKGEMLPEIGYHINKRYQRMGYATEAARICIDYAFNILQLPRVYSYMKYNNIPSCSVAQKCGMTMIDEYDDMINIKTKVYSIDNTLKA